MLVDLSLKPELLNLSASGGLKTLFEPTETRSTGRVDSPFIARDMDTWDDYMALHKEATGEPAPDPLK